jgi:hypothetical protein
MLLEIRPRLGLYPFKSARGSLPFSDYLECVIHLHRAHVLILAIDPVVRQPSMPETVTRTAYPTHHFLAPDGADRVMAPNRTKTQRNIQARTFTGCGTCRSKWH